MAHQLMDVLVNTCTAVPGSARQEMCVDGDVEIVLCGDLHTEAIISHCVLPGQSVVSDGPLRNSHIRVICDRIQGHLIAAIQDSTSVHPRGNSMKDSITREEALGLLQEFGSSENHVRHMLAVEAAMRAYARRFGKDEDTWGAIGLVHDFDYDQFPDEHPYSGGRILQEKGYSEDIVNTILSHGETGAPRDTPMSQALHAVDELTGLLVAVTLVRPSKDIRDVKIKSVRKKWKDKAFAAAVNREEIAKAAEELGVELWEHIGVVLEAMKGIASEIGLDGQLAAT